MSRLGYLVVLIGLFNASVQRSLPADNSYVAAVVEYQFSNTEVNLQNYVRYIQEAAEQNADIIVFPEMTLIRDDAIELPIHGLLQEHPVPALQPTLYNRILVGISAAAREHKIYVVINVEERLDCAAAPSGEYCPEAKEYRFNTNVVLDRTGAVIDRYRKINMFNEPMFHPTLKPDLGAFKTDFGVTFGHFICFDLVFQVPAFQVLEKMGVRDVVFTSMWYSELPFLTSVQFQQAFAYSKNINLLGAGANNVWYGSAGSGIYSGRAGALASTMPGRPVSRLLIATVPKVPGQVIKPGPGPTYDPPTDHRTLLLQQDPSLRSHLSRPLRPGLQEFTLVDRDVTCFFRVNMIESQPVSGGPSYKYRATTFGGVRIMSTETTGGVRLCSVMACTGDTIDTCGRRFLQYQPKATSIFNEITIIATVPTPILDPVVQAMDSGYFPVSVTTAIMPLEPKYYSYSEVVNGDKTEYTLALNDNSQENDQSNELYSFAILGRYFTKEGQMPDPPREDDDVTENPETEVTENPDTDVSAPDTGVTVNPDIDVTTPETSVTENPDTDVSNPDTDVTENPDTDVSTPDTDVTESPDTDVSTPDTDLTESPDTDVSTPETSVTENPDNDVTTPETGLTENPEEDLPDAAVVHSLSGMLTIAVIVLATLNL